jgi:hypothetical protein
MFSDRLPTIILICYRLGYADLIWFVILESIQSRERHQELTPLTTTLPRIKKTFGWRTEELNICSSDILFISGIIRKLSLHKCRMLRTSSIPGND